MSTVELWAALCEHNEEARADIERKAADYKGYALKAM